MVLLHPALSASNRLAAMNSFGTLLNRWHGTSLFRVDGTVLTQFRMIRCGGGHSADDHEDGAYWGAKEEARRAKEEARRAKEEAEHRAKRAKEEAIRRAKEEAQHQLGERRCLSDDEQLRREIHAELRSFSRQTVLPDNMKEVDAKVDAAANLDEKLKATLGGLLRDFTRDFNKHLYLNKRLSAYELEPVLENYRYALRVFFAAIGIVIFWMVYYLLLPRDDGIMPDHRAIIAQQSAIDFDQFVQDYLRAGEVQIVYFYPGKSIAIAVLQPGAIIKGQHKPGLPWIPGGRGGGGGLWKIASRKCAKTAETPIVVSMFRDGPMRQILTAANLAADVSSSSYEHYKYLKALCDLLCALGLHLADVWSYVMKPPPNFSLYLAALSAFFRHPSIYIRAETAQVLATFYGHERISKNADFLTSIPPLIHFLPKAMSKSCCAASSTAQDPTAQYSQLDYEGEVECQREYIRLRDHCLRIIRECAQDHFEKLMAVMRDWIANRCVRIPENVPPDEWEVMKRLITAVLQTSFSVDLATPEVRKEYLAYFDAVFHCSVRISSSMHSAKQQRLLNGLLSILSALFPIFNDFPERIPIMLDHLKSLLMIDNAKQDMDIMATKRHSIALLLKIVSFFSQAIKPYGHSLLELVQSVTPFVSMMQRANLVPILAALSNLAYSVDAQATFLSTSIKLDIDFIENEPFSASPSNFLLHSGLTAMPDPMAVMNQQCPFYQNRLNLKAKAYASSLNPDGMEKENGGRKGADEFESSQTSGTNGGISTTDSTIFMRRFIREITDLIQSIVGLVCARFYRDFYAISDVADAIERVHVGIECVPDFRFRFWIKRTWSRIVCSCPTTRSDIVLDFLKKTTKHMQKRLVEQWELLKRRQSPDEDTEPTEEEMIAESTMSLLSRECALFVSTFILGDSFSPKNAKKDTLVTQIAQVLLMDKVGDKTLMDFDNYRFDKEVFLDILGLLAKLVTCPDSQAAVKCVPILNVLTINITDLIQVSLDSSVLVFIVDFYAISDVADAIERVHVGIECVPDFRFRFWIKRTWSRIVCSCPTTRSDIVLDFLKKTTKHMQKRLVEQWELLKRRQSPAEDTEPTEEEMIAESTMSLLSREYTLVTQIAQVLLMDKVGDKTLMDFDNYRFDKEVFLDILGLLAKLVTCPDSQAAVKCVPILNVLTINYDNSFEEQTAVQMLIHAIQSLQMYVSDELAAGPILTLIFNIYSTFRPRYPALLDVLRQIPNCMPDNIEQFDQRIMGTQSNDESKMHDKIKRDLMRKVLISRKVKVQHGRKGSNGTAEDGEMD
uniref:Transmembrane protein n=1 Tax=Globodera pallida TaxID=36090 RepID=A0A183CH17_GLOPA